MNLSNKPIAMAYVPWQSFENVMDGCSGLAQGTIFEDLIFPFVGAHAACQSKPANSRVYSPNTGSRNSNYAPSRSNYSCGGRRGSC